MKILPVVEVLCEGGGRVPVDHVRHVVDEERGLGRRILGKRPGGPHHVVIGLLRLQIGVAAKIARIELGQGREPDLLRPGGEELRLVVKRIGCAHHGVYPVRAGGLEVLEAGEGARRVRLVLVRFRYVPPVVGHARHDGKGLDRVRTCSPRRRSPYRRPLPGRAGKSTPSAGGRPSCR